MHNAKIYIAGQTNRKLVGFVFFLMVIAKLVLFFSIDPIINPKDAAGYVALADSILAGTKWLHDAQLGEGYRSGWAFRPLGYPALIAFTKWIGGNNFAQIVVAVQSVLTLIACYFLYLSARVLGNSRLVSIVVSIAYFLSLIVVQDIEVMSDSIFSNLTVIIVSTIIIFTMRDMSPTLARVTILGVLVASTMLIRAFGFYQTAFIAIGVGIWCAASARPARVRFGLFVAFLLPTLLVWEGYNRWNEYRTGERFFTTSQFVLLQPVVAAQRRGASVLEQFPLLAEAYSATKGTACRPDLGVNECAYSRAEAMDEYLFSKRGIKAPELARLASSAYALTWKIAPGKQLLYVISESMRGAKPHNLLNFTFGLRRIIEYIGGKPVPGLIERLRKLKQDASISNALFALMEVLPRVFSLLITVSFFIGIPAFVIYKAIRNWRMERNHLMLAWLWVISVAIILTYSLVLAQQRYLISIMAFAILGGVTFMSTLIKGRSLELKGGPS